MQDVEHSGGRSPLVNGGPLIILESYCRCNEKIAIGVSIKRYLVRFVKSSGKEEEIKGQVGLEANNVLM